MDFYSAYRHGFVRVAASTHLSKRINSPPEGHLMWALLSSPLRRWLLATMLLPIAAFALSKLGLYLQRRNGGALAMST